MAVVGFFYDGSIIEIENHQHHQTSKDGMTELRAVNDGAFPWKKKEIERISSICVHAHVHPASPFNVGASQSRRGSGRI